VNPLAAGFAYRDPVGLVRPRLMTLIDSRPTAPGLVVAPAGWGKTTLLAQYAAAFEGPVSWLRIEPADANPQRLAGRVDSAVRGEGDPRSPVPGHSDARSLLIVDDLHLIEGSAAEGLLLNRCLEFAAEGRKVLIGSRRTPTVNLSRHELSEIDVIDAEQLRFRAWEVERLLRDVYREPLPADDVAALSRRVGGWAAGLKLYHLSTHGHPLADRRRAVAALGTRSALSRAYLTRTVLAELPEALRRFLARSCVFDVLTGARCDQLLGRSDSQAMLAELERRQAFTVTHDGGRTYSYHQVLRTHLVAGLVEELGGSGARSWHARAAEILADEGAALEAARCYARAEDWPAVHRLLDEAGDSVAAQGLDPWSDLLPAWFIAEDPWLVLAEGRHLASHGQLEAAVGALRRAEGMFNAEPGRAPCRTLRTLVAGWLPDAPPSRGHWSGYLRAASRRHPAVVAGEADSLPPAVVPLVRAVGHLLAGNLREAGRSLLAAGEEPGFAGLAIRLLRAAGALAGGEAWGRAALTALGAEAERDHLPWLGRAARALAALDGSETGVKEAVAVAEECDRLGDRWGALLATALAQFVRSQQGRTDPDAATRLLGRARALDSGVLAAWAQSLLALAAVRARLTDADLEVRRAESTARSAGVPGARAQALVAAAHTGPDRPRQLALAYAAALEAGLPRALVVGWTAGLADEAGSVAAGRGADASIGVWCFGGFRLCVDGRAVDWSAIRPRARAVARILAMNAGRAVHRDRLVAALWPEVGPAAATRSLHVTLSSLRRFLETNLPVARSDRLLQRDGDAYLLAVPGDGYCDVAVFREAIEEARRVHAARDIAYLTALRVAVDTYSGDLLPEDGPAEWVVYERETLRQQAADAAAALAQAELDGVPGTEGLATPAVAIARRCVEIDPCHDLGWRLLIAAHRRAGNAAAAERARREYAQVLISLGLDPFSGAAPPPAGSQPQAGSQPPAGSGQPVSSGRRIPPPRSPQSAPTVPRTSTGWRS
jgi:DNA-binding SARP family transcriptional activator